MQGSRMSRDEPTVQGRAWRALLEGHRDLIRFLEEEFVRGAGVELQYYDVMFHVSEVVEGRRMTDLAEAVVLTKSGLTSLVDRMERDGLLERRPDPTDRRATRIVLTQAGKERFEAVSRHHRGVVRRIFTSRVTEEEARVIVDVMERLQSAVQERELGGA
jgi:DNA-binding MarR family transcriptional regulator